MEEKTMEQLEEKEVTEQEATLEPEQPVSEAPTEAEPETTSETPGGEISPELTEEEVAPEVEEKLSAKEKLAAEVKGKLLACAEENDCIGALITRFESVAGSLGIPTETLIKQVFGLLKGEA